MSAAVPAVFLGTSDFAADVLRVLAASGQRPQLVVTPPDRRSGRGRKVSPPAAAVVAGELGIELYQTSSVNDPASREAVLASGPELGGLIPRPLLDLPPHGWVNVHFSLLPRWRGAAPIERALMAGDAVTGTCVMRLEEGLDSGPVALRAEVRIEPDETYGSLAPRLADLSGALLTDALDLHAAGELEERFATQPDEGITYAEKIEASDRIVDPQQPASTEDARIRALTPHIGAALRLGGSEGGERLGLRSAGVVSSQLAPGEFAADGDALLLGCAEGAVRVSELQPAGKRWMAAVDYLRGYGVPPSPPR